MSRLSYGARNALPSSSFAEPKKRAFPINDAPHARNALSRVAQYGSKSEQVDVRSAVHKKFPAIGKKLVGGKGKKAAPKKAPSDFDGDE